MPPARVPEPPRMIDLRVDWLAQYAPDTALLGPEARDLAARDLPRIEGYLGATSLAVLALGRCNADWLRRDDPWRSLDDLIARAEAEFAGRLLYGPDDLARWRDDPHGLTWGVLAVAGFDALVRSPADLDRLPALFARGVRVFQPTTRDQPFDALARPILERLAAIGGTARSRALTSPGWGGKRSPKRWPGSRPTPSGPSGSSPFAASGRSTTRPSGS